MTETLGDRLTLRRGETYRARARVDTPRALTPTGAIRAAFEDEGFANVTAYKTAAELPGDWPTDQRDELGGGGLGGWTAFIEGTWAMPDETRRRPAGIMAVWVAHPSTTVPAPTSTASPRGETGMPDGGTGIETLPEITIVGDLPPALHWPAALFMASTVAGVAWLVWRWRA